MLKWLLPTELPPSTPLGPFNFSITPESIDWIRKQAPSFDFRDQQSLEFPGLCLTNTGLMVFLWWSKKGCDGENCDAEKHGGEKKRASLFPKEATHLTAYLCSSPVLAVLSVDPMLIAALLPSPNISSPLSPPAAEELFSKACHFERPGSLASHAAILSTSPPEETVFLRSTIIIH